MASGIPMTREQELFIIENYACHSNDELARMVGLSRTSIDKVCVRHGLRKSREHRHEMAIRAGKASSASRGGKALNITPEVIAKRAESYKKTFRAEEIRVKYGMKQRTKIRLRSEPRPKHDQRINLEKHGYIIDDHLNIAYWTPETVRCERIENRKKGGKFKIFYTFKAYEEGQDGRKMD